jgi:NCAIR mutase (PurE)-related protein
MKRKIDIQHHCAEPERYERQGFPEAVYAPGKTVAQIVGVGSALLRGTGPVLITRADTTLFRAVRKKFTGARYFPLARIIALRGMVRHQSGDERYICVVTAGTTDIPVAEEAAVTAELLGNRVERVYDVGVSGVHRLLAEREKLAGARCAIVCAGMEGALASVVGGVVRCPVVGVPTSVGYGVSFGGVSALLTMLNSCAANVSVVNIDDGFGAGVIAALVNSAGRSRNS